MATSLVQQRTNFVPKDFATLREEALQRIAVASDGRWTNLNESDPGVLLLELMLSGIDVLTFYQDMQFSELYLPTARQRANVINHLKLIGYNVSGYRSAVGSVKFSVAANTFPTFPVTVKRGTKVTAASGKVPVSFITTSDVTVIGPSDSKIVSVVQGQQKIDTFISDGSPNQAYYLTSDQADSTTVEVFVSADPSQLVNAWTNVSSFYASTAGDIHFTVSVSPSNKVIVTFGDGTFGFIPEYGLNIVVRYIISDGKNGNVGRNAINKVASSTEFVYDARSQPVSLNVLNSTATSGGADPETIEHAKVAGVESLTGLHRALSRKDFEALTLSIPGIDKAVAWGENEELNPDYRLFNLVRVCFFSKSLADMSFNPASRDSYRSLRDNQVRQLLTERMGITTRLVFADPVITDIFVTLQVAINASQFDPNVVTDRIRFNITEAYSIDAVKFGQDVLISDLTGIASSVPGVVWARVIRLHTTPPDIPNPENSGSNLPDNAPQPPVDLVLEKWKLPTFADTPAIKTAPVPSVIPTPYLVVNPVPAIPQIGPVSITVTNPDGQSASLPNGLLLYTGANMQHIKIQPVYTIDLPSPSGGFYASSNAGVDPTTYTSLS